MASDAAGLQTSPVVEGTAAGTVLIGASRERVGFDRALPVPVVRRLAAQAVRLFPFLASVALMRSYLGFRPYCPDHLPVIGPDPRAPGLFHACGHEGAGIGLAAGTGHLLAQLLTGATPDPDLAPFRPDRFARPCPERRRQACSCVSDARAGVATFDGRPIAFAARADRRRRRCGRRASPPGARTRFAGRPRGSSAASASASTAS